MTILAIPTAAGVVETTVTVAGDQPDFDQDNNAAMASTLVVANDALWVYSAPAGPAVPTRLDALPNARGYVKSRQAELKAEARGIELR